MSTIKTKPFDLEAIKNGAKWKVFTFLMGNLCQPIECEILESPFTKKVVIAFSSNRFDSIDEKGFFIHDGSQYIIKLIQEPKLASDLSEVKVGDKVWDIVYGWGEIEKLSLPSYNYPIVARFGKDSRTYTNQGKIVESFKCNQSLFLTEIKFEIPEI